MDPLSVAASIVGILAAAAKVAEILEPYVSASKDAPKLARTVHSEVSRVRIILEPLKELLQEVSNPSSPAASYASYIRVDHLIVIFTDGVLLFSELETLIRPFRDSVNAQLQLRQRLLWASKRNAISEVLKRMHSFLTSLSALLNVLQCRSDLAALRSRSVLDEQMHKMLSADNSLASRLATLEDAFSAIPAAKRKDAAPPGSNVDSNTATIKGYSQDRQSSNTVANIDRCSINSTTSRSTTLSTVQFLKDLARSRVYRKVTRTESLMSCSTSAIGSRAMSVFDGLSLTEVSAISVIALPLCSLDIAKFMHDTFGELFESKPQADIGPGYTESVVEHKPSIIDNSFGRHADNSFFYDPSSLFYESKRLRNALSSVPELKSRIETYDSTGVISDTQIILMAIKDTTFLQTLYYIINPDAPPDYISFASFFHLVEDRLEDLGFSKRECMAIHSLRCHEDTWSARPIIRMMNHLVDLYGLKHRLLNAVDEKYGMILADNLKVRDFGGIRDFLIEERVYVNSLEKVMDLRTALSISDEFRALASFLDPFDTILSTATQFLHELELEKCSPNFHFELIGKLAQATAPEVGWPVDYFWSHSVAIQHFDSWRDSISRKHPGLRHMLQSENTLFGHLACHINRRAKYLACMNRLTNELGLQRTYPEVSLQRDRDLVKNVERRWCSQLRERGLGFLVQEQEEDPFRVTREESRILIWQSLTPIGPTKA